LNGVLKQPGGLGGIQKAYKLGPNVSPATAARLYSEFASSLRQTPLALSPQANQLATPTLFYRTASGQLVNASPQINTAGLPQSVMLQLAQMQAAAQNPLATNPFSLSLNHQPQRFSAVGLSPQQQQQQQQRAPQQSVIHQAASHQLNHLQNQLQNQLGLQSHLASLQHSQQNNSVLLAAAFGSQQLPAGYTLSYNQDTSNQFLADPRRYLDPNSPPITTSNNQAQPTATTTTQQQQNQNSSANNSYISAVSAQQASPQAQLTAASNNQSNQGAGLNLASLLQHQQQSQQVGSAAGASQVGSSATSPYGLSTSANSGVANANNPNYMTAQALQ